MPSRNRFPFTGSLFIALLSALLSGCESTPEALPGTTWGHLHHPRYGAAAVTDGRNIYVLGGNDSTTRKLPTERIDTETGEIEILPWQPMSRRYHAAVLADGGIWLFGGETPANRIPPIERIDLQTGKITEMGQLQVPRVGTSAVLVGGTAVIVGGLPPNDTQDGRGGETELLTLKTASSLLGHPLPVSVETSLAVAGRSIHAVGGWKPDGGEISDHYELIGSAPWQKLPDLPWTLSANTLVGDAGHLYSFGDYTDQSRVARYDLRRKSWTKIETSFTARRHATSVLVGGSVYVIGGNNASRGSALNLIESFDLGDLARAPAVAAEAPQDN